MRNLIIAAFFVALSAPRLPFSLPSIFVHAAPVCADAGGVLPNQAHVEILACATPALLLLHSSAITSKLDIIGGTMSGRLAIDLYSAAPSFAVRVRGVTFQTTGTSHGLVIDNLPTGSSVIISGCKFDADLDGDIITAVASIWIGTPIASLTSTIRILDNIFNVINVANTALPSSLIGLPAPTADTSVLTIAVMGNQLTQGAVDKGYDFITIPSSPGITLFSMLRNKITFSPPGDGAEQRALFVSRATSTSTSKCDYKIIGNVISGSKTPLSITDADGANVLICSNEFTGIASLPIEFVTRRLTLASPSRTTPSMESPSRSRPTA